ncbi:tetratricopeptide repeat protein [Kitasatospora sp. NPDC088391]|uniref:tetratricopeptide repeat protein n=1 Tax=Kitasatospora sp. NPDC088391 TaxID=3364074 RepID=UPI00382F5F02
MGLHTGGGAFTGVVSTGDHTTIVRLPAGAVRPVAEVAAPPGLADLPSRQAAFVGRERELALLDAAFEVPGAAVVQAVHGLGGIGKSALAAAWAERWARGGRPVRWITADGPEALEAGLAELARVLQPELSALPPEQLGERAVQWLAAHEDCLLVLDNVEDPGDVSRLLGRLRTTRVLITTRRATGWHDTATAVPLDVLAPAESYDLLARIAGAAAAADGGAELCAELGQLPLAVEQAGAYVAQSGTTARRYLELLAAYPAEMYHRTGEGRDGARTTALVWRLTLDRLAGTPLAVEVLRVLAWYAPERVPRSLLGPLGTPLEVDDAIGRLAAYSMLRTAPDGTLTVHRLLQSLARTPDPADPHRQPGDVVAARDRAVGLLDLAAPDPNDPTAWSVWRALLPHVEALVRHAPAEADGDSLDNLVNRSGVVLLHHGRLEQAIAHFERSAAGFARRHGADHPDGLTARANLATALLETGAVEQAVLLLEAALDELRGAGREGVQLLDARSLLARACLRAGDSARAVRLFEELLADELRLLDPDDLRIGYCRDHLASALKEAGRLAEAIVLLEQAVRDAVRVLGADHPETLNARVDLASAHSSAGRAAQAVPVIEQALADCVRTMGADHPHALRIGHNLASAHLDAGNAAVAVSMFRTVLDDHLRVFGERHPHTFRSRIGLAVAECWAGQRLRAARMLRGVLADARAEWGDRHPLVVEAARLLVAMRNA